MTAAVSAPLLAATEKGAPGHSLGAAPPGFTSAFAEAAGSRLHYVHGGRGPAIVLLHGFPMDWVAFKDVASTLADRFTVVAADLPGLGRSGPAPRGYEAANLAVHVHALMTGLGLDRPYLVGHDLGAIVTYAYVRRYPETLRGAMILDVPVPGIGGWEESTEDLWHLGMIQIPGLAEKMIRPAPFLEWIFDMGGFTPEQRDYFLNVYQPAQLHAAFEIYRAFPRDGEWNEARNDPIDLPLVVGAGETSFFERFLPTFAEGYRARGMTNVTAGRVPDAGHFLMIDNARSVADFIAAHAWPG